jgi:hypothetical protein
MSVNPKLTDYECSHTVADIDRIIWGIDLLNLIMRHRSANVLILILIITNSLENSNLK